jgi:sterol desaturase/sphingolipid hydroxylase (fatty acid hydroxylase superfamily)
MHALLRFDVFLVIFLVMIVWEYCHPRRALVRPRHERWLTNLSLTTLNALLVWGTVGGIAYMTALFATEKEMGLLRWVSVPPWVAAIVTFLVLDFAIYLQHVLFHAVPLLWSFHASIMT